MQRCLPFVAAAIYIGVLYFTGSITVFRLLLALPMALIVGVGITLWLDSQRGGSIPQPRREDLIPLEDVAPPDPPSRLDRPFLQTHTRVPMKVRHLRTRSACQRRICLTTAFVAMAGVALLCAGPVSCGAEDKEASRKAVQLANDAAALRKKGDLPGALNKIDEAVRLAPTMDGAHVVRGAILQDLTRYPEAIAEWTLLEKMWGPNHKDAYFLHQRRGQCRLASGDRAGARADLLEAQRLVPATDSDARKEIDAFLLLADEGLDVISERLKKQARLTSEANALQKKGDLPAALKKANEAVEIMPGREEPRFARAGILMDLKQYKEAAEDWTFLAEGIGPDKEHASYIYFSRGLCRFVLDEAGAQADALEAKRLAPKNLSPYEKEQIETLISKSAPEDHPGGEKVYHTGPEQEALFKKQKELTAEARTLQKKDDLPGAQKDQRSSRFAFHPTGPTHAPRLHPHGSQTIQRGIGGLGLFSGPDIRYGGGRVRGLGQRVHTLRTRNLPTEARRQERRPG